MVIITLKELNEQAFIINLLLMDFGDIVQIKNLLYQQLRS